jgi:hypothetical protein
MYLANQVLVMFRIVFWNVLPVPDDEGNNFTRQYIPEENSELHTRRRENLKSHTVVGQFAQ